MHTYNLFPAENNLIAACKTANIHKKHILNKPARSTY